MRKYILFIIFALAIVPFYSFYFATISEAAPGTIQENEECSTVDDNQCAEHLYCDTEHFDDEVRKLHEGNPGWFIVAWNGICKPKTILDCECVPTSFVPVPNQAPGNGQNAIRCGMPGQPKNLTSTCARSEDICRPAGGFIGPEDRVNRITLNNNLDGGTNRFRGISCEKPPTLGCTCRNPETPGQNIIECPGGTKDPNRITACANADDICRNTPGFIGPEDRIKEDIPRGSGIKRLEGVSCEAPFVRGCTCDTAFPPGGKGITCGGQRSTCANADDICRNTPGFIGPEDRIATPINGTKRLEGISCEKPFLLGCSCANPNQSGGGKNGINCPGGSTFCANSGDACIPAAPDFIGPEDRIKDPIAGTKRLGGVSCEERREKPTPTVPPVPPPPCAPGKMGADGVCAAFLTDFGEIDTNVQGFVLRLFAILLSISGGIALLLIIKAGYLLMVSAGNPEKVKNGREQLVAAIVGLLFIIFSFVILGVIGDDLLKIPGFVAG